MYLASVKSTVKSLSFFVAFLENMNFIYVCIVYVIATIHDTLEKLRLWMKGQSATSLG